MRARRRREPSASTGRIRLADRELQQILLEIHDGPVQHMYAALSQLDLLRGPGNDGAVGRRAGAADRSRAPLLEAGLRDIRTFIGAYRTPAFESGDAVSLLEGLALRAAIAVG